MKHTATLIAMAALAFALQGCDKAAIPSFLKGHAISSFAPEGEEIFDGGGSYAFGMNIGTDLRTGGIFLNMDEFVKGMQDAFRGDTRYTMDEAFGVFQTALSNHMEKRGEAEKQKETDFLEENARRSGVTVTESGLQYEVVVEGDGARPGPFDTVRVNYEGRLADGTVFDSSIERGEPAEFPLFGVIPGWAEGLQLMTVGSTYRLFVPSELGYGPQGAGPQIPPYSALVFDVELIAIVSEGE